MLVGISGGVDSSVAALLLKGQGYDVEGVFAKVWQPDFVECTWRDEMRDAMRVCAKLDIPFHFLDLEKEYKADVGDYMIEEYRAGRTPNPDVMCNTHIKFGRIYDFAMAKGFDFVATGHYARTSDGLLARGVDGSKDQSYFLWNVARERLESVLFPIGELEKSAVRDIAKRNGLFTAEKKDSQGLCFIGPVDMKAFLKELIEVRSGPILDEAGKEIGEHDGAALYTVGERHGFSIMPEFKESHGTALYVLAKDMSRNALIVGREAPPVREVALSKTNLLAGLPGSDIEVQFRYRQAPVRAILEQDGQSWKLRLSQPVHFVAEGQSAVLYAGAQCLGGGIVEKVVY